MAGVGIIQLDLSEANQACGEFANKLHFSLSSPLYGTFAALKDLLQRFWGNNLGIFPPAWDCRSVVCSTFGICPILKKNWSGHVGVRISSVRARKLAILHLSSRSNVDHHLENDTIDLIDRPGEKVGDSELCRAFKWSTGEPVGCYCANWQRKYPAKPMILFVMLGMQFVEGFWAKVCCHWSQRLSGLSLVPFGKCELCSELWIWLKFFPSQDILSPVWF